MEIERVAVPRGATPPDDRADDELVAVEVRPSDGESYADLVAHVATVLTAHAEPWELLSTSERDTAINRSIGFWRRHGRDLETGAGALEAAAFRDGQIDRAAATPLADADRFQAVLSDPLRLRFRLQVLLPTASGPDLVEAALRSVVAVTVPRSAGYGFLRALAVAVAASGSSLLVKDETARHTPCLLLIGGKDHITSIVATATGAATDHERPS
jgi:hypothetical protein